MKVIIATEEVLNEFGDLVKIIYHYEDKSTSERTIFIPAKRMCNRYKPLKG